jgi:ABC-2 type transport system ATP-binding protein
MDASASAITVTNLQKAYKTAPVLLDVSFNVEPGTIFALLGSNGAGKTTTINLLTTLLNADGGTATVNGFDVASQPGEVRKNISLSGQFAAVDDVLTGRENLVLIGRLRHIDDPTGTADALLKQYELADAADLPSGKYSGGMRRRLDLAMSLIGDAPVIFLDEPTTGLDPQSRNMAWGIIKGLAKGGTTIFLTTQNLDEADELADKIAVLSRGRIVAEGTPVEIKEILPHGRIELKFHNAADLNSAASVLADFNPLPDVEARSLAVETDGTPGQVARLFSQLQAASIDLVEFSQKQATLDDAFLKIIGATEGRG